MVRRDPSTTGVGQELDQQQYPSNVLAVRVYPFGRMIVFGDSLSDTGNLDERFAALAGWAQTDGRFTSGLTSEPPSDRNGVWHEFIADTLVGIRAIPSRGSLAGTNYAYGGAVTDDGSSGAPFPGAVVDNVGKQVADYTALAVCQPGTVYTIWGGGNDLMNAANAISRSNTCPISPCPRLPAATPLFDMPDSLVGTFDRDLAAAGIAKKDERSRTVDVHALRHTSGCTYPWPGSRPGSPRRPCATRRFI